MTEMAEKKTFAQHSGDVMKYFIVVATAIPLAIAAIAFFLEHKARELTRDLAGTDDVIAAVEAVAVEQRQQRAVLETVVVRVDRLEPDPRIAEYDTLRSSIDAKCRRGHICNWRYLVRRTDFGATCIVPKSDRIVRDRTGITHFPDRHTTPTRRRLDTEWANIQGEFIVPDGAALGVAEFFLDLVYSKCGPDRNQTMAEASLPLVFEIIDGETP